jgi:hypothetical protein
MKPEEVVELLKDVVEDRRLIFMAIEELRILGHNVVHLISSKEDEGLVIYITFMYRQLDDELAPIAVTIEFHRHLTKKMQFALILDFVKNLNGFVFGGESSGILIPISTGTELKILVKDLLPGFLSKVLGKEIKFSINRYELEYVSS